VSEGSLTDTELRTLSANRLKRSHSLICSKGHKFEVLEKDLLVIPARHQMIVGKNGDEVEYLVEWTGFHPHILSVEVRGDPVLHEELPLSRR
jgi:hypothetical protein